MSQLTQAAALLDSLKQNCIDAWGLFNKTVEFDLVRIPQTATSYVVIDLLAVGMDFQGATSVEQTYNFRITARFPFPASGNILLAKITNANLLIAEIITASKYASIAYQPIIREVAFEEEDRPQAKSYEFSVLFECKVSESHH